MGINILFIILLLILIWRIASGFQKGMVKEIISFVTLVVLSLLVVLLGLGLDSYMDKEIIRVVVVVILILILIIAYRLLDFFFFTAKLFAKLPVVKTADKLLGAVIGIAETIIIIWVMYALLSIFDMGNIGVQLWTYINDNMILKYLYKLYAQYPAQWIAVLNAKLGTLPFEIF